MDPSLQLVVTRIMMDGPSGGASVTEAIILGAGLAGLFLLTMVGGHLADPERPVFVSKRPWPEPKSTTYADYREQLRMDERGELR